MRYQARFIEHGVAGDEADGIDVIDINPFASHGEKNRRVLISEDDEPLFVLQLFIRADEDGFLVSSAFCELLGNDQYIAIICGDHLHIFEIHTRSFSSLPLNDCVGHIYPVPDTISGQLQTLFLVATYCYVFLIHISEGIVWQSSQCAIDGVIISNIEADIIYGEGEWDPPGGWQPFRLSLKTGRCL